MKKKQDGGHNIKILILFVYLFVFIPSKIYSSVIVDYETEEFIKKINKLILSVNDYNKIPDSIIILDSNINAYVNQNDQIYISSGLIEKSPSYISLLSVLAHEIGHIEKFHITKRKESINNLSSLNTIGTLSMLAGAILTSNAEVVQALAASKLGINNFYINFTKEQEREADHYAIETINKLNLPNEPLIKLLNLLEEESLRKGLGEEYHKFSTHPIYKQRYDIADLNKNIDTKVDSKLETEFSFIRAKFLGYSSEENTNFKKYLSGPHLNYANSIFLSRKGNLKESLLILNNLIDKYKDNYFLIETKADILLSYGYKDEAIKFYQKVFTQYPNNKYVQTIIFNNTYNNNANYKDRNIFFNSNINLLFEFPNFKIIYLKYKNLSKNLKKEDWLLFFKIYEVKENIEKDEYINALTNILNNTKDKNLTKLIKIHINLSK